MGCIGPLYVGSEGRRGFVPSTWSMEVPFTEMGTPQGQQTREAESKVVIRLWGSGFEM